MLQRVEQSLSSASIRSEKTLRDALDAARETAVELGELTREEAHKAHTFVTRDLVDLGAHVTAEERELADQLRLGLLVLERDVLNRFSELARAAKAELKHLEMTKQRFDEWHTGEVTTTGTLRCRGCGERMHFERTGHIPPCPKCHATVYDRVHDRMA
jgi:hypothetical protein